MPRDKGKQRIRSLVLTPEYQNAVYIGTIAVIATLQSQMTKALPQAPAPQLALFDGKLKDEFNPEEGSLHLANFLRSCTAEMVMALQAMGKSHVQQLSREDLVSVDQELAKTLNIGYAGEAVGSSIK